MSRRGGNAGPFVRRKRAGWERLDVLVGRIGGGRLGLAEVEELDRLYRRAAGDLAFARTAFPGTDVEGYLSQVTAHAYQALYRRRRPGGAALRALLAREIPDTFVRHARLFALSAALLASGALAGALAVLQDPAAAAVLVPPGVRSAVEAGRMWTDSLLGLVPGAAGGALAHHNATVCALVFAGGLTGGVLTGWLLFANGLLLGAVAAFCATQGMGLPFLSFVGGHAPGELTALALSGQAGFLLAGALVDPGEWPRREALQRRARQASRLLLAVAAMLPVVGLIESTVSPGRLFPPWAKVTLGLSVAAALQLYLWRGGASRAGREAG